MSARKIKTPKNGRGPLVVKNMMVIQNDVKATIWWRSSLSSSQTSLTPSSLPQFDIQEQAMFAKCIFREKNCLAQNSFRKPKKANGEPWKCPPLKILAFYPQICGSAQKNAKLRISKEKANPHSKRFQQKVFLNTSCDAQMLKAEKCRT